VFANANTNRAKSNEFELVSVLQYIIIILYFFRSVAIFDYEDFKFYVKEVAVKFL